MSFNGNLSRVTWGRHLFAGLLTLLAFTAAHAQPKQQKTGSEVAGSPAYAEVLLRRTELQAEAESLSAEYTEEHPKVAETRFALEAIERERARLLAVKAADAGRLSAALGKLMVRKAECEVEVWGLRKNLQDAHPDVKRAKRKGEIYEAAIKEILGQ